MNILGEMYGERAIYAPFALIAAKTSQVGSFQRTMIGGVVIDGFGGDNWERWRGTMILIPNMIDKMRKKTSDSTINQMMTTYLGIETEDTGQESDSFWKSDWKA